MEKFPDNPKPGKRNMGAKPEQIRRAQLEGDVDYLKAAGRKGNLVRRRKVQEDALFDERRREQQVADEAFRQQQNGEDTIPASTYD